MDVMSVLYRVRRHLTFLPCLMAGWAVAAQELPQRALLVGHWSFDEGEGQWAGDASGFAHNGFLGLRIEPDEDDPEWVAEGKQGRCLRFDGEADRVLIPHAVPATVAQGLIVEAWFMQTERTPFARIVDKGQTFDIYVHESGWVSFRLRGLEAHGVHGDQPVPLSEWVKVRGEVYDGKMRLLLNDTLVKERDYAEPIEDTGHDIIIGASKFGRPFQGLIDEVKMWNVGWEPPPELEPPEADEHTVGLWHLDSAEITDASGTQSDGELLNGQIGDGRVGKAIRFHGDGWARIPDDASLDLTHELCLEAWVNPYQRGRYARIMEKSDWTWGMWVDHRGYVDFFFKTADGAWHHNMTRDQVPLRRWTHVRAEFDGLWATVYLNGQQSARNEMGPGQDELQTSDQDLYIGNRQPGDRGFVGLIDEVRVSDRVRTPRPPVVMEVSPLPSQGIWAVRASVRGLEQRPARLTGTVRAAAQDEPMRSFAFNELTRGIGTARVEMGGPEAGEYVVSVLAEDANGQRLAEQQAQVIVPDATPWLAAKAGVTDQILPPWTPLAVELAEAPDGPVTVACWGREYGLEGGCLPARIASAQAELLPTKAVLGCKGGSGESTAAWQPPRVAEQTESQVVLMSTGEAAGCALRMRAEVEFDGMVRYDLEVEPPAVGAEVEELRLDIPLDAARATLMHYPSGKWFEIEESAGAVPADGWQVPNTWYLWVGDEDRGLCWFAEDQEAWGLDADKAGISLTPEGDRTVLRVWLINAPTKLEGPRKFTWGLMATPVKPMPAGWRAWRFGSPRFDVNVAVQWSVKTLSKWHSFPVPHDPETYVKLREDAHAKGQHIVPYTNFNMQSNTGEVWDYFGAEWDAHAGRGMAADVLAMDVINMRCCPLTESWLDFITWKYRTFLEQYDWDGFYLDNSIPGRCNNPHHPDEHKNRVHIFGTRELMKRIYAITKLDDPDNVMVCHMSSRLCIPLLSFCDAYVDGEQYHWALDEFEGDYMALTSLARVRAELMGRQWGLIPLFLPELSGPAARTPARTREMLALLLPHGMRFWAGACHRETLFAALDALDEFGLVEAEFLPYSSDHNALKADDEDVIVSAYRHEEKGVLLILSNLGDEERQASVRVDLRALGLAGQPQAEDVLDGAEVGLAGEELRSSIPARDFRLIVLHQ